MHSYTARVLLRERFLALEGEGIPWIGQPSLEIVPFSVRIEFWRSTGLVFCKPDGSQLMQRDILKHSLHPILKKLGLEQGGLNIFRRFRITKLETAEVPAALQHTWSGHAKSHVSEVYKKLLKQREWRLRWAEKTGTGFALSGHQQAAAEASNGKPGKLLQFRKVG